MGHKSIRPDRATVERILSEEAAKDGLTMMDLLSAQRFTQGHGWKTVPKCRARALDRICAETGCSITAAADAIGFDRSGVCRAVRALRAEQAKEAA
jgi:hypothetical protein